MDLYNLLEVERSATQDEIRKAYLKLSKKHHPDKGGDAELFKKIQKAYDVLSDKQAKDFYDMTGSIPGEDDGGGAGAGAGPMGGAGFPFDMGNIFSHIFGGAGGQGGRHGHQPKQAKGPTKVQEIGLTLQQFYNGHRLDMTFERMKFCDKCAGSGASLKESCKGCSGSGVQSQRTMMGPIIMASTIPCTGCGGKGTIVKEKCGGCNGDSRVSDNRQVGIMIEAGMGPGDVLLFENGCSDDPMFEKPGDIKIILQEAEESHGWKRIGDTLEASIRLTLGQSLVGVTTELEGHPRAPDGIYVTIPPGTISGDVLVMKGDGMPVRGGHGRKGDARLRVVVVATAEERAAIEEKGIEGLRSLFGVKADVVTGTIVPVERIPFSG